MNDALGLYDYIDWVLFDKDGNVKRTGHTENQVQTLAKELVIDALDTGSITAMGWMAVGTGWGASVTSANLFSKVSLEVATQTQPTSVTLQNVSTFTAITGTVTEAGLFNVALCTSGMLFYSESVGSVVMTNSDSLQITWTITASSS